MENINLRQTAPWNFSVTTLGYPPPRRTYAFPAPPGVSLLFVPVIAPPWRSPVFWLLSHGLFLPGFESHVNGIIECVPIYVCLISLDVRSVRRIQSGCSSLFLHSSLYTVPTVLQVILSTVDDLWGCSWFWLSWCEESGRCLLVHICTHFSWGRTWKWNC